MASLQVSRGGAELYVETHGPVDGPPALLLHGGVGSAEDWVAQVPALVAAGWRVVAMDGRARGHSTWGDEPLTFEVMAADMLAVLASLGIAQADLSAGAMGRSSAWSWRFATGNACGSWCCTVGWPDSTAPWRSR